MLEHDRGDDQSAVGLFEQARDLYARFGDQHLEELARVYYALGKSRIRLSQFAEGEQELDRSDRLVGRLPREPPEMPGLILNERAVLARDWKGDLEEAERLFTAGLASHRKSGVPYLVADGLNSLAVIKMDRGKLDEALALYEEALAQTRQMYGDRSPAAALTLENLGSLYSKRGEWERNLTTLTEVLSIREEAYGADSAPAARTRINMGLALFKMGRFEQALEMLDVAIALCRKHYGEQSLEVAVALSHRAGCLEALGDLGTAARHYESALAILDAMDAPTSGWRLSTLLDLTRLRCKQRSPDRARSTADLALAVLEPETPDHREWIGKFEEAIASCASGSP
jgi:tetratricopeptide (TPR) repeat protein